MEEYEEEGIAGHVIHMETWGSTQGSGRAGIILPNIHRFRPKRRGSKAGEPRIFGIFDLFASEGLVMHPFPQTKIAFQYGEPPYSTEYGILLADGEGSLHPFFLFLFQLNSVR